MPNTAPYPEYRETDVVLRDGTTLRLRPVRRGEAASVLALFQQLSPRSLYQRFMQIPRIDWDRAVAMATVDYDQQFVLVAEHSDALVAIAGYYRDPVNRERAEVAFAVADVMQGRGLGTRLLERLGEIAREHGVGTFDAFVLADNRQMIDVFVQSGFHVTQSIERGVMHMTLDIDPTEAFFDAAAARSRRAAAASIRPFFEPRAIAVVGANREPRRIGSEILRNLRETGFTGTLLAVHPVLDSVGGCPAYRSVRDIPMDVDLAVIVVPAAAVSDVVDDCISKGVKALVVISAGFGETGAAGRALEADLVEKIRAAGIRLIGPNCMGILNTDPAYRLNATFSPVYPPEGGIAFSTQSGALGLAILEYVKRLNLGISSFASIGNKADVSGNDLIQFWADDPRTKVILLYLESFGNPRQFARIARRVGRTKPIVAVKAGRSQAGARAASSHTGARAASDALVETLLCESGVIRTHTLEEMFDVASLLSSQPVPAGRRVGIVTNAGGPAILAADACEANGLELAPLSAATQKELRWFLPATASVANPVDMIASAAADEYRRAVEIVASDPNVDSVIAIFIPPLVADARDVANAIKTAAVTTRKTVLATFMGVQGAAPDLAPVPTFAFPESAAVALARVTRYGEWLRRPVQPPGRMPVASRQRAQAIVASALAAGGGWMSPAQCEDLLVAAGVPVVESHNAWSVDEAITAAASVQYPVVLKAYGATLLHKTEAGGIKLALQSEKDLRQAYADLQARLGERLESVIVQPMLPAGVEMVVGGINDPSFGPVVMCGTGGTFVELLDDTALRLCPLSEDGARDLIEDIRGKVLLRGFRGSVPVDEAALRRVVVAVSQVLDACPEIHEMDLNPVIVSASGAVAVDVRIRIGPRSGPPRGRRIAY